MKKIKQYFNKYYVVISIIIFFILMLILLGFYPGLVSYDSINQWEQVQSGIITDAHPFFSTYFMLILSKIWNNYVIVIVFQIALISFAWGYFCKTLNIENNKKKIIIYIYSTFVFLTPMIALFSITLWKDIIYTSYLFLAAIILFNCFNKNCEFSTKEYCIFGFILSMIYSYRHNGIIVAILIIIIFYTIYIKKYRKKNICKKCFIKSFYILFSFLTILLIISIPKKIYLEKNKIENNKEISYSTLDNYMLWMMGAHLNDNNIHNKEDKEFLNKIIPVNEWKEKYDPYLINNITLYENLDKKFLIKNENKFRNIFFKYLLKNPNTIVNHYFKADSLLINPIASFQGYVYVYCYPISGYLPDYTMIRSKIPIIEMIYDKSISYSFRKPFILFYEPAILLYLSIIMTIILSKKVYGKKVWAFSMPMILNTISLLPINLAQDLRYVYINYLTFFGLLLLLILKFKKLRIK